MVYESREGDAFLLGSSSWRITQITHDRVEVVPAPADTAARMPFWHGDSLGRSLETGKAVGRFVRDTATLDPSGGDQRLPHTLDRRAAVTCRFSPGSRQRSPPNRPDHRLRRFRETATGGWSCSPLFAGALPGRWRPTPIPHQYGTDVDGGPTTGSPSDSRIRTTASAADLMLEPDEVEPLLIVISGTPRYSPPGSARRQAAPYCSRGVGPTNGPRFGCSAGARQTCWVSPGSLGPSP
jgi:ATP-dependent Lhr-like helicase